MTTIVIKKANPTFIIAIKEAKAAKKERFQEYFSKIETAPSTEKLKQMKIA